MKIYTSIAFNVDYVSANHNLWRKKGKIKLMKKNNMYIFLKVNYNKQLKMKKFIDDFNIMLNKLKL